MIDLYHNWVYKVFILICSTTLSHLLDLCKFVYSGKNISRSIYYKFYSYEQVCDLRIFLRLFVCVKHNVEF